jgi:RNA polymerase sigma factor (sigma-70 family)
MLKPRTRPARGEIDEAALGLASRHGAQILATARRYAATPEDAEDAYQRGLEILLTKAPTTREEELIPWLKTVVKHEAFALRRQRDRHSPVTDDGHLSDRPTPAAITHDQAERLEKLSQGAEALRRLKPHEIRALVLKAEGYSYREICELTGWSYTKVNRLLTEGRQAFLRRVAAIQGGGECERLAPLLSKLVDGEATADDLATLRPHIRTCLSCRAALREYRAAPRTAAALVPVALLASSGHPPLIDLPARAAEALAGWTHKAQAATELASAQKVAAVAASTAVLGGGAAVTVHQVEHRPEPPKRVAHADREKPAPPSRAPVAPPPSTAVPDVVAPAPQLSAAESRAREAERTTPPAQQEFEPAWAAGEPTSATATASTSGTSTSTDSTSSPQPTGSGGGAEEFAP